MQTKRTLFDIGRDWAAFDELIEELGGDISHPDVELAVTEWFAELSYDEGAKLDNWIGYIRQLEMEAAVAKSESDQFARKAKTREQRIAFLKHRMKLHLELGGRKEVTTPTGRRVYIQTNSSSGLIYADDLNLDQVPEEFVVVRREVHENSVKAALKEGRQLEFARFAERGSHLRIG